MRETILDLLNGKKIVNQPAFSGLIHITSEGLQSEELTFNEIHIDSLKMAKAAASTFKLTGLPSAALPLDLCAPAEMLGAELRYYPDEEFRFPQVGKVRFESTKEITEQTTKTDNLLMLGRLRTIGDAIQSAKKDIGKDAILSGLIPGPFTLLLYACKPKNVFIEIKKNPQSVYDALERLADFLAAISKEYIRAGADFITVHEMGGSPGFIGPNPFEMQVLPSLKRLHGQIPVPRVLSVCGNTNAGIRLLAQAGASAISVDQLNDLSASRAILKDTLLFGNIDPVAKIWQGDSAQVAEAASRAREAGVDAIWPGCDLAPQSPLSNIKALLSS